MRILAIFVPAYTDFYKRLEIKEKVVIFDDLHNLAGVADCKLRGRFIPLGPPFLFSICHSELVLGSINLSVKWIPDRATLVRNDKKGKGVYSFHSRTNQLFRWAKPNTPFNQ